MGLKADITANVHSVVFAPWVPKNAIKVPADNVALKDGVARVEATYLYADMVGTSKMAHTLYPEATAKSIKSFLAAATRLIRFWGGEVRSFDGDRVMGIFMGADQVDSAVRCAMGLNWAVEEIIHTKLAAKFTDYGEAWKVAHVCGIDTGEAHIVTAGIAGGSTDNRDMVSIGTVPNAAAKLSDLRGYGGTTYITENVYQRLPPELQKTGAGAPCWSRLWNRVEIGGAYYTVYGSNCWMEL